MSEFDEFAKDYDEALDRGISLSGESKDFFALGRIDWISQILNQSTAGAPSVALDFGCGTGTSCPLLKGIEGVERVIGVDPSADSLEVAAKLNQAEGIEYKLPSDFDETELFDISFCNGVFHHIPEDEREGAFDWIYKRMKPGGLFFFWENNPLNIGTQIVMSRIPFDRDAIKITPWHGRSMLKHAGFSIVNTNYLFFFPAFLKILRGLEPKLSGIPFGAQYLVIARK